MPGGQGNLIGADPLFVTPFVHELTVSGSRLDPQTAAVTITGADPPVGLTGDYHLGTGVAARSTAASRCSNTAGRRRRTALDPRAARLAPCGGADRDSRRDFDGQFRPQLRTLPGPHAVGPRRGRAARASR